MQKKSNGNLTEERMRRRRISRMKTTIIMTVGIWIIVSMLLCIGLMLKVVQMERKIDELVSNAIMVQQVSNEDANLQSAATPTDMQGRNVENDNQADEVAAASTAEKASTDEKASMKSGTIENDNKVREGVKQKVYLTFDDGPSENTAKILDILKEKGVKATFFVIGNESEEAQELYQRIVAEGHTLGMHSYSHKYSVIYESLESFQEDFVQLRDYLKEVTGVESNIMRFPGGSSNQVSNADMTEFIQYLNQEGITYYDWNVASGDATSQAFTPEELIENVLQDVVKYDSSIILMHDTSSKTATVESLEPMIDQLQAMDMELLPIDSNTKLIQHNIR